MVSMPLLLVVLTVAIAICKRRLFKTPIDKNSNFHLSFARAPYVQCTFYRKTKDLYIQTENIRVEG